MPTQEERDALARDNQRHFDPGRGWVATSTPVPISEPPIDRDNAGWRKPPSIRTFETGATRNVDDGKYDYEAFLSPLVLARYARYMHKHRYQADGTMRDGDNWQKGMPKKEYMKSGWRHFMDWWTLHRAGRPTDEALCALLFNVMGYLHEELKGGNKKD